MTAKKITTSEIYQRIKERVRLKKITACNSIAFQFLITESVKDFNKNSAQVTA